MVVPGQRILVVQSIINKINADKIYLYTVHINGCDTHYATVIVNNDTEINMEEILTSVYHPLQGHKGLLSVITLAEDLIGISNLHTTIKIITAPAEDLILTKVNYYNRMNRAKALIKAGESLLHARQPEVSTTLFSQCISQVCIAVIRLYSGGYEPKNLLLPELLDLCKSHWPDHYLQVQRQEPKHQALYQLLYKSEHPYKHDSRLTIKREEMLAIHQLCKDFLYEAGIAGIKKLDELTT
ncbi:hypothetical protein [Pedobacter gandavensis]|uniref:hypothetical protein n=1 Tax=Pedobacter gandavensis TaxID=2679963 RepID=UPI00292D8DAE|nr:hypothetical protein [Pedobacter gandavensis]